MAATWGLASYFLLLRGNVAYRWLFVSAVVGETGTWFSYVAQLTLIQRTGGHSAWLISVLLTLRLLPGLTLSPLTGTVADAFDKPSVMVVCDLLSAAAVTAMTLVRSVRLLPLLYALIFLNCAFAAQFDPAKQSLIPLIVRRTELKTATTLDGFSWSFMLALGSALGGFAAARFGVAACFLIDAATYLVSAACVARLLLLPRNGLLPEGERAADAAEADAAGDAAAAAGRADTPTEEFAAAPPTPEPDAADERAGLLGPSPRPANGPAGPPAADSDSAGDNREAPGASESGGVGLASVLAGYRYLLHVENRDLMAYVLVKCTGAAVWGAADVINVQLAADPRMHSLGGSEVTLGYIFASVGFGCILAPFVISPIVPQRELPLLCAAVGGFVLLPLGYGLLVIAPNIIWVLLGTALRAAGSATLWVFSTLLIQLRGRSALLGRVFALELTLFTLGEISGYYLADLLLDGLGLSAQRACAPLALMGGVVAAAWGAYFLVRQRAVAAARRRRGSRERERAAREVLESDNERAPLVAGPAAAPVATVVTAVPPSSDSV